MVKGRAGGRGGRVSGNTSATRKRPAAARGRCPPAKPRAAERSARERYIDQHLHSIYYNLESPAGFSSIANVSDAAATHGITQNEVRQWLLSQETYARFRPARRKHALNFYSVNEIDRVWEADLCDYRNLEEHNDGYRYILTIIDCLSRYLWAYAIRSKGKEDMAAVFRHHFASTGRKCKHLQTDHGLEFTNSLVQDVMRENGIAFKTIENRGHACLAERVNKTIKSKLHKVMIHRGSWKWIEALPQVVAAYNQTRHSSTGYRPADVNKGNAFDIWAASYTHKRQAAAQPSARTLGSAPRIGDHVRVSIVKSSFEKGYTPRFSQQIYKITDTMEMKPFRMYILSDLHGHRLKGRFYREELLTVPSPTRDTLYRVEKILKRRQVRGRQAKVLVRWEGWEKEWDSWEFEKAIQPVA